jgi:hypothetical protein
MMNKEGHESPPPTFGAPTLVWHLGISPHTDKRQPIGWLSWLWRLIWQRRAKSLAEEHPARAKAYDLDRQEFYADINDLLKRFHQPLAYPRDPSQPFFAANHVPRPWQPPPPANTAWRWLAQKFWRRWQHGNPFWVTHPENIRFTLWWPDALPLSNEPPDNALRIKVHATAFRDYVSISFYIDVGKLWNGPAYTRWDDLVPGGRRQPAGNAQDRQHRYLGRLRSVRHARPEAGVRLHRRCRRAPGRAPGKTAVCAGGHRDPCPRHPNIGDPLEHGTAAAGGDAFSDSECHSRRHKRSVRHGYRGSAQSHVGAAGLHDLAVGAWIHPLRP